MRREGGGEEQAPRTKAAVRKKASFRPPCSRRDEERKRMKGREG